MKERFVHTSGTQKRMRIIGIINREFRSDSIVVRLKLFSD